MAPRARSDGPVAGAGRTALVIAAALGTAILGGGVARAAPPDAAAGPPRAAPPVVLVLAVSREPALAARERRLRDELGLVLDGFVLLLVQPADPAFLDLPLPTQVDAVRPLVGPHRNAAVVWLAPGSADVLMLHLLVMDTGRILVKSMPVTPGRGGEVELALMVRELLGTAYLFEPRDRDGARAVQRVVEDVRARVAGPAAPARAERPSGPWLIHGAPLLQGAASSAAGPTTQLGGRLGGARLLGAGVTLGLEVEVTDGPRSAGPDASFAAVGLMPALRISYRRDFSRWLVDLGGGPGLEWRWLRLRFGAGPSYSLSYRHAWVLVEPRIGFRLAPAWAVLLGGRVGWTPERDAYRRLSDGLRMGSTPAFSWAVSLALEVRLGRGASIGKDRGR